jgi:hypothetical protein
MEHAFQFENIREETPLLCSFQNEIGGQNIRVKFSSCTLVVN